MRVKEKTNQQMLNDLESMFRGDIDQSRDMGKIQAELRQLNEQF